MLEQSSIVHSSNVTYDKRSQSIGFIRGDIFFLDGSRLHIREFVYIQPNIERYMYVYHYQDAQGTFIFRYDNTAHFPTIPTFPHHKHAGSETNIEPSANPDIAAVIAEIQHIIGF